MLTLATDAQRALRELQGWQRGTLRVGARSTPGISLRPPVLAAFVRRYPGITLAVEMAHRRQGGTPPLPDVAARPSFARRRARLPRGAARGGPAGGGVRDMSGGAGAAPTLRVRRAPGPAGAPSAVPALLCRAPLLECSGHAARRQRGSAPGAASPEATALGKGGRAWAV
jgi:DNA-binding transcriptional LysR family regulator